MPRRTISTMTSLIDGFMRRTDMILPYSDEVREARMEIGFSQKRAGRLVHSGAAAWRKWETIETSSEHRQISGASWELFIRKTDSLREKDSRFKLKVALR